MERMPQLWMAAFDLQQVAQFPARRLLQEGETPVLFQLGTASQPLLPLSYVAWQPEGRRKAGMKVRRQGGKNGNWRDWDKAI